MIDSVSAIGSVKGYPINIGAAITFKPADVTIIDMVNMADRLMYQVKKAGKSGAIVNEIEYKSNTL